MADVPPLDRLLKKFVSGALGRSTRSTYRLVRLASNLVAALLTIFLSNGLLRLLKRRTADDRLHLARLKGPGRGWTFTNDLDDDEEEHDVENDTKPEDIRLNPASVADLFFQCAGAKRPAFADFVHVLLDMPVIDIVATYARHHPPDKTDRKIAGQIGREYGTNGIDEGV